MNAVLDLTLLRRRERLIAADLADGWAGSGALHSEDVLDETRALIAWHETGRVPPGWRYRGGPGEVGRLARYRPRGGDHGPEAA